MGQLSGADYLMAMADECKKEGLPFAEDFADMLFACFSMPPFLATSAIAQRPLTPEEQAPALVVAAALDAALSKRDWESVREVVNVGISLGLKFHEYLEVRVPPGGDPTRPDQTR